MAPGFDNFEVLHHLQESCFSEVVRSKVEAVMESVFSRFILCSSEEKGESTWRGTYSQRWILSDGTK